MPERAQRRQGDIEEGADSTEQPSIGRRIFDLGRHGAKRKPISSQMQTGMVEGGVGDDREDR